MKLKILIIFILTHLSAWRDLGSVELHLFKNRVFFETRALKGDNIQKALQSGFSVVYSMENDTQFRKICRKRFGKNKNVYILNSQEQLWIQISKVNEPITFWLDFQTDETAEFERQILFSLERIKKHSIKNHTILIDDLQHFDKYSFDFMTIEELVDKIFEINSEYTITFLDGGDHGEHKHNILAAYIDKSA